MIMKIKTIISSFVVFSTMIALGQPDPVKTHWWRIYNYSGELSLNSNYQVQQLNANQIKETQSSFILSPAVLLRAKSFIWHPRFATLDLDASYSPTRSMDRYLVIPDQLESRTAQRVDIRLGMLPKYKISLNGFFNYGNVYTMRENLYNTRSKELNWGGSVLFKLKKLPVTVSYTGRDEDQLEINTNRRFKSKQSGFEAVTYKSFGKRDKNNLSVSHNEYYRNDYNRFLVNNKINMLTFNNFISFGKKQQNNVNAYVNGIWQQGYETFNRYQFIESINLLLKKKLQWGTSYSYFADQRAITSVNQHRIGTSLQHQLYQSLNTQLSFDYNSSKNTNYQQSLSNASINLAYTKKVMEVHNIDISYRYSLQTQKWNSKDVIIPVFNETITLKDGEISLLFRPNINISSIRVKNTTGNIIYLENADYMIITRNNYIQVQRISGGQIPNNTSVAVDYVAVQPGTYAYTSNNDQLQVALSFFNRLFSIYYKRSLQDYSNLRKADVLVLNYFTDHLYGAKIDYAGLNAGVELDNNLKNSILPYKLVRYFMNYQDRLLQSIDFSATGNYYDYKKLNNESNIHYLDLAATATYLYSRNLMFTSTVSYRKQEGERISLNLLNYKARVDAIFLKTKLTLIYNLYNRKIFSDKILSNAINIQLVRKFR